jgi:hypothetical protein
MQRPRTPGGGITGAKTAITLGSRITGFLPRTGLPPQRAIAIVARRADQLEQRAVVWLTTTAGELREVSA